jgi:sortase A
VSERRLRTGGEPIERGEASEADMHLTLVGLSHKTAPVEIREKLTFPAHLQPMVQSLANLPVPTAAPDQAIRIQIPAIKIDAPVVQGDGWEQLKKGVGQNVGSANPGQDGNVVLSAHNDVYGELFRYLDKLQPGDQVVLYTQQRQYTYVVDRTAVVEPTAVEVMASTGSPTVTLISCYPYLVDKQRIVVFARLQN